MKKIFFSICLLIFLSCGNKKKNQQQNNVPEALQDNKKSSLLRISKRGPGDLVDELYKEKLEKDEELLTIDRLYQALKENKTDSLEKFLDYDNKNRMYYKSADLHLKQIEDSLLKKEIETVLINSINKFHVKSGRLTAFENALNNAAVSANDRYTAIKLFISLGMMESYQDDLPSSKPIETMIDNFNSLNKKLDSVISKNK